MRKAILGILAVAAVLGMASAVEAAEGCGEGWHRGPYGHCRPNAAPVVVAPGPVVVAPGPVVAAPGPVVAGVFYPGRGWWDGHRYWWHRDRWHGGWRYR